jgi:hypothetical protein
MIKELDLQNSTCSYVLKLNIDPLHLQRAYFVHFETNLNDFCNFGYIRWRITKSFQTLETIEQIPNIYEFLSTSLHYEKEGCFATLQFSF